MSLKDRNRIRFAEPKADSAPEGGLDAPRLLTPREAAEMLRVSERTLWTLANAGAVPVVRFGRATRYDPDDIRALIASRKSTATTAPPMAQ